MGEASIARVAALALPGQRPIAVRVLKRRYAGLVLDVTTAAGRHLVLKTGTGAYDPELEAAMLAALRAGGLPVPAVVDVRAGALVLEHHAGRPPASAADWSGAVRALRELHGRTHSARYGFERDTVFGTLPLVNGWADDWPQFFRDRRLRPLLEAARSCARLPEPEAARLESICEEITTRMPPPAGAALIHGDFWADNILITAAGAIFLDPACFYADPDYELAFALTYAPREASIAAAWQAGKRHCEAEETRLRTGFYRLSFHLAHLVLFGRPCFLSAVRKGLAVLERPQRATDRG